MRGFDRAAAHTVVSKSMEYRKLVVFSSRPEHVYRLDSLRYYRDHLRSIVEYTCGQKYACSPERQVDDLR